MSDKEEWLDTYDTLYETLMEMKQEKWTVQVEEDKNRELLLTIPPDLLSQMGWSEGTELWWDTSEDGKVVLKEKKE